ncbi:MAG TPA: hypothetical protein VGX37_09710 [Allosphingosinicella sp.]|nr:hypothetical protein [Allosphingosinicella sp.]
MARFNDPAKVEAAFAPYLEPGEQIRHVAYGVRQPPIALIALLFALAVLPGAIAIAVLTKEYVVALTDRRFIALRFKSKAIKVQEVQSWPLAALPPVKASTGGLFTHIAIEDPAQPFRAKFHRLGMPGQREQAQAIEAALGGSSATA